ncbi:isocitrate dehydrogenase [NAD] regulatory subunit 1, mitochondrial-like [Vicia villosa]|uniref:isocitrate dehydrogenase [NAD] regulatory subunit 1, mitochondrial-like n=1 Tax=Vicia villosa TaxID=3911 RepID=UPI00273A9AC0|nr:isocitrate dehydrogenase [NAD] regulatory subunit 1, mitochondrial-like [Vicia villosa]
MSQMEVMHTPVYFEKFGVHGDMKVVSMEVLESIRKNKLYEEDGDIFVGYGFISSKEVEKANMIFFDVVVEEIFFFPMRLRR